jgi:hypothetical protein
MALTNEMMDLLLDQEVLLDGIGEKLMGLARGQNPDGRRGRQPSQEHK